MHWCIYVENSMLSYPYDTHVGRYILLNLVFYLSDSILLVSSLSVVTFANGFFLLLIVFAILRWVPHFDWSDFLKWNHIWIWNIKFGAEVKKNELTSFQKGWREWNRGKKRACSFKMCGSFLWLWRTCDMKNTVYHLLAMTITRKRCFSAISFNNRAGKCKFFMFRKNCAYVWAQSSDNQMVNHFISKDFFLFIFFFWNSLFSNAYHECAWYVRLPFRKRLRKTQPNVFHAIGYSGRGHLTFILLGKISSSIGLEYLGILLCMCMFHLSLLVTLSNVWPSFIRLNVRCSCFCKPRLFFPIANLLFMKVVIQIDWPLKAPLDHRWFVGSRIELITFKIFVIYIWQPKLLNVHSWNCWLGNKIAILKWSYASPHTAQCRNIAFVLKVNNDWSLCADGLI